MARTLISMPSSAKRGEIIEIKTLIAHPMETGYRPGSDGKILPRDLIQKFSCAFESDQRKDVIFSADLYPAVAANPYMSFFFRATQSGTLIFTWSGDKLFSQTETKALTVT
jgi:sulfur-oxidizing protein SoxZ